jgi:hypothetical protein
MGRPLVRSAASALDAAVARMPTAAASDDDEQQSHADDLFVACAPDGRGFDAQVQMWSSTGAMAWTPARR